MLPNSRLRVRLGNVGHRRAALRRQLHSLNGRRRSTGTLMANVDQVASISDS
jgi:hypothetical protein